MIAVAFLSKGFFQLKVCRFEAPFGGKSTKWRDCHRLEQKLIQTRLQTLLQLIDPGDDGSRSSARRKCWYQLESFSQG